MSEGESFNLINLNSSPFTQSLSKAFWISRSTVTVLFNSEGELIHERSRLVNNTLFSKAQANFLENDVKKTLAKKKG